MRKIVLMAVMALCVTAFAQNVTPLNIQLADCKIDSLRTLYMSEPTMYRASLEVLAASLEQNAKEVKAARAILKDEQAHSKEMAKSLKSAASMTSSLRKIYAKEEAELKKMQKSIEQQQRKLKGQKHLNEETRNNYAQLLEAQQKELGYALRETAERQRAIADLETALQNEQTKLQAYDQQMIQKATELTQIEAELKNRVATLKSEQKAAKSMK